MDHKKLEVFAQDKILGHIDKIYNWLNDNDQSLITVELDMTNKCNAKCPQCAGGRKSSNSLSEHQALSIIKQIADLNAKAIIFSGGGEPLLNPSTLTAIKYASKIGLDVGLITNGIELVDTDVILKHCTWCRISLDAGTSEVYEMTHGQGNKLFVKVVNNIKRMVQQKKLMGSKCTIGTGYLTGKSTMNGMLDFAKLSKELGVDYAQFRPFHHDAISIHENLVVAKKLETDTFKMLFSEHKYNHFDKPRSYDKCYGVNFAAVVTADYEMTVCCHTRGMTEFTLGDLNKNSLIEIWSNRQSVFDKIDISKCLLCCRCDTINIVLDNMISNNPHGNFL